MFALPTVREVVCFEYACFSVLVHVCFRHVLMFWVASTRITHCLTIPCTAGKTYQCYDRNPAENADAKKGKKKAVWCREANGANNGTARFGTMQIAVHPGPGEQCPLTMIFPGTGVKITQWERKQYAQYSDVKVFFQKKAWADAHFCRRWLVGVFLPHRRKVALKEVDTGTYNVGSVHTSTYRSFRNKYQLINRL